jgi:hypothetical protein
MYTEKETAHPVTSAPLCAIPVENKDNPGGVKPTSVEKKGEGLGPFLYPSENPQWLKFDRKLGRYIGDGEQLETSRVVPFPASPKCDVCGESDTLADPYPHWWFHLARRAAHCPECQENHWWADGYEIDEWGDPHCWNPRHTREQRIAERDLHMLEIATPGWKASAEGKAELQKARRECYRRDVRPTRLCELLNSVAEALRRYVTFPMREQADIIALFVAHTWVFDAAEFTAYIFITAASKRSGKSRLLEVLKLLVKNARKTEGATSAALVRTIDEKNPPTFLLDEVDKIYTGKNNNEGEAGNTCRLLNAGFERGATFLRCVGQGAAIEVKEFAAFCPKALAGIGRCLPDTVADRSITIELVRQTKAEKAERLRKREAAAVLTPLRERLQAWAQSAGVIDALREARPDLPDVLNDRVQDISEPIVAIADMAGGSWPERARSALVKLAGDEEDADLGVRLLSALKAIFDERQADWLPTKELLQGLVAMEDGPWALWFEDSLIHDKIKAAGSKLYRELKRYRSDGVEHSKRRIEGESLWGYTRSCFEKVWSRYLGASVSPPAKHGTNGTDGTDPSLAREKSCSIPKAGEWNVPSLPLGDGTQGYEGKTANVPSVPTVPSDSDGKDFVDV